MKIERTKNASRNMFFGIIQKIIQIVVPFVMRTAMIYFMGVQYLGLNSLFTSLLQVINLAELGVGSAMIYSMYKPIADDDNLKICAILNLYRKYYNIIGFVIAIIGLSVIPLVPELIKEDVPLEINVYIIYLINLGTTVLSYWLLGYRSSILYAHQRVDITSRISLVISCVQYFFQFIVLWIFNSYYFYVLMFFIGQVAINLVTARVASKMYPNYKPKGDLDIEEVNNIKKQIKALFTAKLGAVIVNSVDTIVISAFLGLTTLAIYQNYYFILSSIYGIIGIVFTSIVAGIGNSLIKETLEKNYNDLLKLTFIISWIINICCCCFAGLYQPFMEIWVGKELMLDYSYVILFCILFYVLEISMIWATVKDAAGMWYTDRYRTLIGAFANLCLNLILVNLIGLYGIMLSTILSYVLITMPWIIHNIFKYIYKTTPKYYLKKIVCYILATIVSCLISIILCYTIKASLIVTLIINAFICVFVPNVVFFVFFKRTEEYKTTKELLLKILRR